MAFVCMKDIRLDSERAQNPHTAYSKHDLLPDAVFFVASRADNSRSP
jgi:hypothetical protein